jgi:D-glycero-alpha-D-manno-heptose-7-phosphate kinase
VVSATINRYVYVRVSRRADGFVKMTSGDYGGNIVFEEEKPPPPRPPFEIALTALRVLAINGGGLDMDIRSDVPPGSGLGSSGTVAVNMVNVLASHSGKTLSRHDVAEKAYEIGHDALGFPIGKQDEYAAAYGGLNEFVFTQDGVQVSPLRLDPELIFELENNLMLFYLCETRDACAILKEQDSRTREGDPGTIEALHRSREFAIETRKAIEAGDIQGFGRLLTCSWEQKKKYANRVTNPRVDTIYRAAISSGAWGAKLTGAGGAGHLLVCCPPEFQTKVEDSLRGFGVKRVPFKLEPEGVSAREVRFSANC